MCLSSVGPSRNKTQGPDHVFNVPGFGVDVITVVAISSHVPNPTSALHGPGFGSKPGPGLAGSSQPQMFTLDIFAEAIKP